MTICRAQSDHHTFLYTVYAVAIFPVHMEYSGTPLLWAPWGPGKVSCIEIYTKKAYFGPSKVSLKYRVSFFSGVSYKRGSTVLQCTPSSIIEMCFKLCSWQCRYQPSIHYLVLITATMATLGNSLCGRT